MSKLNAPSGQSALIVVALVGLVILAACQLVQGSRIQKALEVLGNNKMGTPMMQVKNDSSGVVSAFDCKKGSKYSPDVIQSLNARLKAAGWSGSDNFYMQICTRTGSNEVLVATDNCVNPPVVKGEYQYPKGWCSKAVVLKSALQGEVPLSVIAEIETSEMGQKVGDVLAWEGDTVRFKSLGGWPDGGCTESLVKEIPESIEYSGSPAGTKVVGMCMYRACGSSEVTCTAK